MAQAVHRSFTTGEHLTIQGPTGVGKSLAYLIPAVMAARRGLRTVVVTSSKALQDQLASVELPFLAQTLGLPFRFAVLKGRSNYLCEAAVADVEAQLSGTHQEGLDLGAGDEASTLDFTVPWIRREVETILEWRAGTTTGDQAELDETPDRRIWSAVSVGPSECVGAANCAYGEVCWSEAARAQAEESDIVVVNAHLYGAHIQMGGTLLPEHALLVIDEAHEFEDSMVGSLSVELTGSRVEGFARQYRRCVAGDDTGVDHLRDAAERLEDTLAKIEPGRLAAGLTEELTDAVEGVDAAVDRALTALRSAAAGAESTSASSVKFRIDRAIRTGTSLAEDCTSLRGELGAGSVMWVEEDRNERRSLRLTRIDIGDTLRRLAWQENEELTVVCCSATLDVGTGARLGLRAEFRSVPSPFDFASNSVLYVPKIRRPNDPRWPDDVADEIEHLIRAANGRTLALFTSNRMLRRTVDECRERLPEFTILAQGDAPNPVLHQRFLDEEHTCLFATASFWTGMSNPGTTCSVVVVDKIPFPVPSDPVVEARNELVGDAAFMEVSVPAAGMQLAQGVGRLIRTSTDRGVVAVCDTRLAEARYRNRILDLLPPMRRARNRDFVDHFIAGLELDGKLDVDGNED